MAQRNQLSWIYIGCTCQKTLIRDRCKIRRKEYSFELVIRNAKCDNTNFFAETPMQIKYCCSKGGLSKTPSESLRSFVYLELTASYSSYSNNGAWERIKPIIHTDDNIAKADGMACNVTFSLVTETVSGLIGH